MTLTLSDLLIFGALNFCAGAFIASNLAVMLMCVLHIASPQSPEQQAQADEAQIEALKSV